eukprot:TRINITY_DN14376_c0_g1_i4.p3 TRINITY_DN14376_c0_g1~~TRINITY_DN14376_c0_g1_i4.p3  ORF type:complete len:151 (-),score=46.77 TRINITY_DN14376_c0_g1_i4:146-598(-)
MQSSSGSGLLLRGGQRQAAAIDDGIPASSMSLQYVAVPTPQRERHLDLASALLASPDASQACHPADAAAGEASQMRQCQEMLPPAKKLCRRVPSGGVGQAAELPAQARRGEKRSDPPEVIVARASFAVKLKGMKEPHVGTIALSESDSES